MKRLFATICLVFIVSLAMLSTTYEPQTVPNPRDVSRTAFVCNPDSILSEDDWIMLQALCAKIHKISEVELVVVPVRDIGEMDAFDFAHTLFNLWGIGNKEKNTGVLLFLATESRDIQIITGDGVEGILPDSECGTILDEALDDLSNEQWGQALINIVTDIGKRVTTQDALEELLLDTRLPVPNGAPWSTFSGLLTFGLGIFGFRELRKKKCPKCHKRKVIIERQEIIRQPTYTEKGERKLHYKCLICGHIFEEKKSMPKKFDSSSGSSSDESFGGGYSGGYNEGYSSSGGHSSGGSFGGGSFGGGHSSGGGAGRKF